MPSPSLFLPSVAPTPIFALPKSQQCQEWAKKTYRNACYTGYSHPCHSLSNAPPTPTKQFVALAIIKDGFSVVWIKLG